ncbi:hypothetical protein [Lancefieldella parvula]|uniref:hypothetical protein n=1 Tax=Lancefieldella parvula TaxID=1382 RepID=UPI0029061CB1|nr:hypothetical protein [Lancefieldella parvula]MDU4868341.1 hypothetical protein [Lancefieldella parvula]
MNILEFFDFKEIFSSVTSGLVVTGVVSLLSYLFISRYAEQISFSKEMKSYGFTKLSTGKQTQKEIKNMCNNATLIQIINVSGFHFLNDNEDVLKKALKRDDLEIQFLCANPNSEFLKNIETMEQNTLGPDGKKLRQNDSRISEEIDALFKKYKNTKLRIKFYNTEYRLPYIIAHYPNNIVKAWLTITLPPYKSTKSFILRGENQNLSEDIDNANFIDMIQTNFDTIWNYGSMDAREELLNED